MESIFIPKHVSHLGDSVVTKPTRLQVDPENPFYAIQDGALFDVKQDMLHTYFDYENTGHYDVPAGTRRISQYAFRHCAFESISIPEGVSTIEDWTFTFAKVVSVTLPGSITSIGERAFFNCNRMSKINIPEGVVSIGDGAFASCENLASIKIPRSVTFIGSSAFGTSGAPNIWADEGSYAIEYAKQNGIPYTILPEWL